MVFGPTQRPSGKPSHIDFHAFSKVWKPPILRAGGTIWAIGERNGILFWEGFPDVFGSKINDLKADHVYFIFVFVQSAHFSIFIVRLSFLFFIVTSLCFKQREKKTKKSYDNNNNILSFQPICVSSNFLKILKPYPRLALASRGETSQTLSGTSASAGWTSSSPAAKNLPMYLPVQWIFWT